MPPATPAVARAAAVAILVALAAAAPAAAHTDVSSTRPPAGAVLAVPPTAVTVTYSAPLGAARSASVVAGGREVAGRPRLADGDARRVVIPVAAGRAPAGAYRATWTVAGADGHELTGALIFSVRTGTGAAAIRRVGRALLAAGRALGAAAAAA